MSKKKLLTSITAVALAATMVLGGTFAWQSINQTVVNEGSNIVNPGGRLHDDYDGDTGDKDVYVENFASNPIYARIRLEEYFKVAVNTGHGNKKVTELVGSTEEDAEGNVTYNYEIFKDYGSLTADNAVSACVVEMDEDGEPVDRSYFEWTMGSEDSETVWYMPTFNLNKDSLVADVNGSYKQGIGVISSKDVEGGQYNARTDYKEGDAELGTEIYDADENTLDEVGDDFDNLDGYVTGGSIRIKENVEHTAESVAATKGLISMSDWLTMVESAVDDGGNATGYDADEHGGYWVYDTDGWVYWSGAIAGGQTTGLLLDSIRMTEVMDEGWYYALNVVAQFITAGDMGQKDGTTGFYDANNGTAPTENALKLLEAIGVNTEDAESAEALDKSNWVFTVTDNDGDDTNNPTITEGDSPALTYRGTATEFTFAFGGADSGWTLSLNSGTSGSVYRVETAGNTSTIYVNDPDAANEKIATWDGDANKLTMEQGKVLSNCSIDAEKKIGESSAVYSLEINEIECVAWYQLVTMRNLTNDEYDALCEVTSGGNDQMHWQDMYSWAGTGDSSAVARGYIGSASNSDSQDTDAIYSHVGLRPAFEVALDNCKGVKVGDLVVMGTLYDGTSPVKVPANPAFMGDITRHGTNSTDKITLGAPLDGEDGEDYKMKAIYIGDGVFVCDRCMMSWISWTECQSLVG